MALSTRTSELPSHRFTRPVSTGKRQRMDGTNDRDNLVDWTPRVDIRELNESFIVRADLAGVEVADIEATLEFGRLTLSGHRNTTSPGQVNGYNPYGCIREFFFRQLTLPGSDNGDKVSAIFSGGVLVLFIPKIEQREPLHITVKS